MSNVLSQEEIDKLAGMSNDNSDDKKEENIDISSMLSQDEINEVAGNLNELTEQNEQSNMSNVLSQEEIDKLSGVTEEPEPAKSEPEQSNVLSQEEIDKLSGATEEPEPAKSEPEQSNVLSQEEIDKLSGVTEEPEPVKSEPEQSNVLSQEEIDKLSGNDVVKEEAVEEPIEEVNNDIEKPSPDTNNLKKVILKDKDIEDTDAKEDNKETGVKSKKKIIIIAASVLAVILLSVIGYFSIGYFAADKPENEISETANNEDVFVDKKKEEKKEEKVVKKKPVEFINKGVNLFLDLYKKNGIEETIIKSEELIVEHDMDISEENLKLCLAFDLSASLIDTTKSNKAKIKPNEYFQITKLNQRYKKRLMNAGYNNEEADKLILKWGKKTIELLKEKIKKSPKA